MTDPVELPEVRWLWRRITTILVSTAAYGVVILIVVKLTDPSALKWIGLGCLGLICVAHVTYLTGSTITDWARLAAAVKGSPQEPPP